MASVMRNKGDWIGHCCACCGAAKENASERIQDHLHPATWGKPLHGILGMNGRRSAKSSRC